MGRTSLSILSDVWSPTVPDPKSTFNKTTHHPGVVLSEMKPSVFPLSFSPPSLTHSLSNPLPPTPFLFYACPALPLCWQQTPPPLPRGSKFALVPPIPADNNPPPRPSPPPPTTADCGWSLLSQDAAENVGRASAIYKRNHNKPELHQKMATQNKGTREARTWLKREEEGEGFITNDNWSGKHNSLSRVAGADQTGSGLRVEAQANWRVREGSTR